MGGRTVVGLFGIFGVIGINGRHIDQVDGKGPRLGLVALGEALGAIGVATNIPVVVPLGHVLLMKKRKRAQQNQSMPHGAKHVPWSLDGKTKLKFPCQEEQV